MSAGFGALGLPQGLSRSETEALLASGRAAMHDTGSPSAGGSPAAQEKRVSRTFEVRTERGVLDVLHW